MDFSGVSRRVNRHLYVQLAGVIEAAIRSGELRPGDPLPSERYLCQEAGVSRAAVRHALQDLRERGLVVTTADFTPAAVDYAARAGIRLVDGTELAAWAAERVLPPWGT